MYRMWGWTAHWALCYRAWWLQEDWQPLSLSVFGAKEVKPSLLPQGLSWNSGWQVIMPAVPEARGVPTLKDHLSFPVTAGFTGWYFIPFEAAHSRPLFRSEFSFFRARKGLSSLVQLSGINLFYSSFKFFLMQMNNFRRSRVLGYAGVGRWWLVFWTVGAVDWLGEETSDSH